MAGRIIMVAPRQTYTWTGLQAGNTAVVWLGARAYPAPEAVSGVILVTASTGSSFGGSTSSILFEVVNVLVTGDEPNVTFAPPPNTNVGSVSILSTDTLPVLKTGAITGGIGAMVAVRMTYTQAGTGTTSLIAAVELVLRDA